MPHHEGRVEGHDGLSLYRQCWLPQGDSRAVVIFLHGFTEHSGRYAELAERLCSEGYAVYAMDLRGHGKSAGDRAFVRSFDEFLADLDAFLEVVRRSEPDKPLFLFGHSMGGAIIAHYAITRRPEVRGLLLSAPPVSVGSRVFPILRRLASLLSRLFPRLRVVRMGFQFLSRDAEVVAQFNSDPLVFHGRFPVRIGAEILQAAKHLQDHAEAIRLPLLILQGTGDRVVDPQGAEQLHEQAASRDKKLRLYAGLYHDLLHEPEKAQVAADLIEWLNARR